MKLKNKNIQIGNIVRIIEKYNEEYHNLESDREFVGIVDGIECVNNIKILFINHKRLLNIRYLNNDIGIWQAIKKIPKMIGISWFGSSSRKSFLESEIKLIEVLKK